VVIISNFANFVTPMENICGGELFISVRVRDGVFAGFVVARVGMLHRSYIEEKLGEFFSSEQDLVAVTALVNWLLFDGSYAEETWQGATKMWGRTN
jgi:hypothetical protein